MISFSERLKRNKKRFSQKTAFGASVTLEENQTTMGLCNPAVRVVFAHLIKSFSKWKYIETQSQNTVLLVPPLVYW